MALATWWIVSETRGMNRRLAVCTLFIAAASCGSDDNSRSTHSIEPTATTIAATTTTTVNPPATTTTTIPPSTTTSPATDGATTSQATCVATGDVASKSSADPLKMSGLVGKDIRTGLHPCYERVVIELQGAGEFPGWTVEYQDDPITLEESNEVALIKGDATIIARLGSWMQNMEYEGYAGPRDIFPTNVSHIFELRLVENNEGVTRWAIGVDHKRAFTVAQLADPPRLVIDVETSA
jgi:hypothetical protein